MMYSVFVMWRALVLDRLGKHRLEPEPAQNEHEVHVGGTRTKNCGTQCPGIQELWCSVPRNKEPWYSVPRTRNSGTRYPKVYTGNQLLVEFSLA